MRLVNRARTEEAARVLRASARSIVDFRRPFQEVAPTVASEMAGEVRRRGLVRTGRLLALVGRTSSAVRKLTPSEMRVGPNERYQFVQHYGSVKRNIKAAPYIYWTGVGERALDRAMRQHVDRTTRATQARLDALGAP